MKRKMTFTILPNDRPVKTRITVETTGDGSSYQSADLLSHFRKVNNGIFEKIVAMFDVEEIQK